MNDPLYNHVVFGPEKGKDGNIGKTDEELIHDLISIHNAENWLGGEGDDFAPNFFSGVIPPESNHSAATPNSGTDSAGVASAVSSRSQTPDTAALKDTPTATTDEAVDDVTKANGSDSTTGQISGQVPEASASPATTTDSEQTAATAPTADSTNQSVDDVKVENPAVTIDGDGDKELTSPAATSKLIEGQFHFTI